MGILIMYEQKYIGVLHPNVTLRYLDFLFYDHIQLMENKYPTNDELEILLSSDILKRYDDSINLKSGKIKEKHSDLATILVKTENHYWNIFSLSTPKTNLALPEPDINIDSIKFSENVYDKYMSSIKEKTNSVQLRLDLQRIEYEINIYKAQAYAAFLSFDSEINAIPILPENITPYSKFVSGHALKFLSIGVPKMPIRDLIRFKFDNQDKLRRLRLAINELYNAHDNFDYVLEEISLSLSQYNKSVEMIKKKYDFEVMELKFGLVEKLLKFLLSFDLSVFSNSLRLEKAKIQKQIECENIVGVETSYLYEVGRFIQNKSQNNMITQ